MLDSRSRMQQRCIIASVAGNHHVGTLNAFFDQ